MALPPEVDFDALIRQMAGETAAPATTTTAPAATTPTTARGRMAAQVPTLAKGVRAAGRGARGFGALFGRALPFVGPAVAGIGEVTSIAESAADPEQSGIQTTQRAVEGISRLAGMGAGAGLGFAGGGPWGALAGGAAGFALPEAAFTIRDLFSGGTKPVAVTPPVVAPSTALAPDEAFIPGAVSGAQGVFIPPTATPIRGYGANNQPYQPVTRTVNPDGTISITGEGSPRFSGGAGLSGFGAAPGVGFQPAPLPRLGAGGEPARVSASVGNIAGNYMGALIGLKQAAGAERRSSAQTKMLMDYMLRRPAAEKAELESEMLTRRLGLNPLDPSSARAASLIGGPALPAPPTAQTPLGIQPLTMDPKNPVANVFDPATRTITSTPIRPAQQTMTRADVAAQARAKGETLEQGLARARKLNIVVTE